ncbi:MAG: hypothetical protein WD712_00375 [Candidatus Spechtbacterales bacterium]
MRNKASAVFLLIILVLTSPASGAGVFWPAIRGYEFSVFNWEMEALAGFAGENVLFWQEQPEYSDSEASHLVMDYLDAAQKERNLLKISIQRELNGDETDELAGAQAMRESLEDNAKRILSRQVQSKLAENGIDNPFGWSDFFFPPINFEFFYLPKLLVISERGGFKGG